MKILKRATTHFVLIFAVIALAVWGYQAVQLNQDAQNPKYCVTCHEMQPAYYTWQATAHSQIKCNQCHQKLSISTYKYEHALGQVKQTITTQTPLSDDTCRQCHGPNRTVSPPGDLIIPHDLHSKMGIGCVQCHSNVAHANSQMLLSAHVVTAASFTQAEAARFTGNGNRVPMATCMGCHNGVKATEACAACHKELRLPPSHQTADWAYNHGAGAFTNLQSCNHCHNNDLVAPKNFVVTNSNALTVTTFARNNTYCQGCHTKRPVTHTTLFAVDHAQAAQVSRQGCYVCHDPVETAKTTDAGKLGLAATSITCDKCHTTKHPADWLQTHQAAAKSGKAKCLLCHDEQSSCNACHNKRK